MAKQNIIKNSNQKGILQQGKLNKYIIGISYTIAIPLILIMNLLSKFTPKHWVSRAKTLLKRRKKAVRSRPISNKKLKQEIKHFNYAKQYKALQIQKELDKRKYASQHINELMDQIFYPDITLANEQAMKINMQIQVLKQYKASQSGDELEQVINENVAASQLIEIYENNSQQFTVSHFSALFSQLSKYFKKRDKIKERIERKWNKMNQNLKKNNANYKQKKCPYIFIDKDDVYHYQPWNRLLQGTYQYFQNAFSNQPKNQQQIHKYWEYILAFSNIVQDIHRGVGLIPVKYYQKIEQLISKLPQHKLLQMPLKTCSNLLKSLSLKDNIRFEAYSRIEQPQLNKISQSSKTITSLITRLLTDPEASTPQFQNVLTTLKSGVVIFNQEIQKSVKPAILSNLSSLPFERVVEILTLYLRYDPNIERQFIELIKYDALRKCPMAVNKRSLFKCMNLVRRKYIQSQNMEVANPIFGYDLLQSCVSVVCSKYFGSNQLNYNQILQLIDIFYDNSVSNINFLQFLASQLVKIRQQTSLQELTSSVFRLFLLGYRSPVLSRILYEQQKKRYREAVGRVKQQEIKLLEGQTDKKNPLSRYEQQDKTPTQQILLQQDLLISIWLLFLTNGKQNKIPVSIDQLMHIYPISINSKHPLIHQICLNLNKITKSMSILWQIKCRTPTKRTNNIANRLDKFYEHNLANPILKAMMLQAEQSSQFVYNYHVKSMGNNFIRQPWSDAFCYGVQQYLSYIRKNSGVNYFNREYKISEKLGKLRDQALRVGERRGKQGKQQKKTTENVGEQYYKLS